MNKVISIVPQIKASDEVKESVIQILEHCLEEARNGEITSLIVILRDPNGDWINRCSDTENFSDCIGRLEITKQEWIASYLANRED